MLQDRTVGAACLPPQRKRGRIMRGAVCLALAGLALWLGRPYLSYAANFAQQKLTGPKTVADRLAEHGVAVDQRLAPDFARAGVNYPPARLALLGFKQERRLELHAAGPTGAWRHVRSYPILGASGELGPKLREGDGQVPEGRTQLGGDIMIHGNRLSVGCLAMGDTVAEDLFVLAARTGLERIMVLLSPVDFRQTDLKSLPASAPGWTAELYAQLRRDLRPFPAPAGRRG